MSEEARKAPAKDNRTTMTTMTVEGSRVTMIDFAFDRRDHSARIRRAILPPPFRDRRPLVGHSRRSSSMTSFPGTRHLGARGLRDSPRRRCERTGTSPSTRRWSSTRHCTIGLTGGCTRSSRGSRPVRARGTARPLVEEGITLSPTWMRGRKSAKSRRCWRAGALLLGSCSSTYGEQAGRKG